MNCKPGDLALTVFSLYGNHGKLVEVLRPGPLPESWFVRSLGSPFEGGGNWAKDSWLRPIRPETGEDEILRIAGKPQELPADVIREVTA